MRDCYIVVTCVGCVLCDAVCAVVTVWSKASQWHEMLCHDPKVKHSKVGLVKLRGA